MLFFEHEGVLIYFREDYQGLTLNNNDLQKGVNIMDLLCMFLNLGIDGKSFIDSYVKLLRHADDNYYEAEEEYYAFLDKSLGDFE